MRLLRDGMAACRCCCESLEEVLRELKPSINGHAVVKRCGEEEAVRFGLSKDVHFLWC